MIGDLRVNRLGFGAMRITGQGIWGAPGDPPEARAVLRRAVELGVNLIDTADAYGPNVSEQLIYEALHPYPPGLVIATKGGYRRPGPDKWEPDGSPAHLRAACEDSLRRLHLERIDLYQLHTPDPKVPFEESINELSRLRQQGKIRHVGVSNVTLAQLKRARTLVPVVSAQNQYNLSDRSSEDVLRYCAGEHLAFLPWAPLAGRTSPLLLPWSSAAEQIAKEHMVSTAQVALAWLLARSHALLPIPGTSSRAHLEDNIAAATLHLTPSEMQRLS
jgi:aryl-alcohol dehydrogenase-like predicted oxidoreductase